VTTLDGAITTAWLAPPSTAIVQYFAKSCRFINTPFNF